MTGPEIEAVATIAVGAIGGVSIGAVIAAAIIDLFSWDRATRARRTVVRTDRYRR